MTTRSCPVGAWPLLVCAGGLAPAAPAQTTSQPAPLTDREKMLLERIEKLERAGPDLVVRREAGSVVG